MLQQLAESADDDKELEAVRYVSALRLWDISVHLVLFASRRQRAQDDVAWMQHETQRLLQLERQREQEIDELYQCVVIWPSAARSLRTHPSSQRRGSAHVDETGRRLGS